MSSNIIYNGFRPNEIRVSAYRTRPADLGHTTVMRSTRRLGSAFRFRYEVKCQCGKRFSAWQLERAERSQVAHQIATIGRASTWGVPYKTTKDVIRRSYLEN